MKQLEELANIFSELAKELKKVSVPIGAVQAYATKEAPDGWMKCDGAELRIEEYSDLYSAIGDTFKTENTPEGFFCIPDLQGQFIRGWDEDGNVDAQRDFGTLQEDAFQGHKHSFILKHNTTAESGEHNHSFKINKETYQQPRLLADKDTATYVYEDPSNGNRHVTNSGLHTHPLPEMYVGDAQNSIFDPIKVDNETRPKNIALLYCIKVK